MIAPFFSVQAIWVLAGYFVPAIFKSINSSVVTFWLRLSQFRLESRVLNASAEDARPVGQAGRKMLARGRSVVLVGRRCS